MNLVAVKEETFPGWILGRSSNREVGDSSALPPRPYDMNDAETKQTFSLLFNCGSIREQESETEKPCF